MPPLSDAALFQVLVVAFGVFTVSTSTPVPEVSLLPLSTYISPWPSRQSATGEFSPMTLMLLPKSCTFCTTFALPYAKTRLALDAGPNAVSLPARNVLVPVAP